MDETRDVDTRKLLKIFGVAVTQFEDRAANVLERLRARDTPPDRELLVAIRELLDAVTETNAKWQQVTDHLFAAQRDALAEVTKRIASLEGR